MAPCRVGQLFKVDEKKRKKKYPKEKKNGGAVILFLVFGIWYERVMIIENESLNGHIFKETGSKEWT